MTTIVLAVSRLDYLDRVISSIELQDVDPRDVSILCIVDGDDEMFVKVRNLINTMKYDQRLVVPFNYPGTALRFDIKTRRERIAAIHNQAGELIPKGSEFVFSVEDDTVFASHTLRKLIRVAVRNRAFASAEGVELGRWGIPYVGAWVADDIYNPTKLKSVENIYSKTSPLEEAKIDAGGLFCTLIRADLYKEHEFTSANGLGPDVNFGIWARQLGNENFIHWGVPCNHFGQEMGKEIVVRPTDKAQQVTLVKVNNTKWRVVT